MKSPRPLQEQVIVLTGASTGIGRETALQLGKRGSRLVLAARNEDALRGLKEKIEGSGGQAEYLATDVAEQSQVERLAQFAVERYGRIDTWINDAAVATYSTVEETSAEEVERILQVNFMGSVYGMKAVLPIMKLQGSGTIINVGSIESERAFPYHSAYAASKHAIKGFTDSLRLELAREDSGIHVVLIKPSGINTPFFVHSRSKLGVEPQPMPPAYEPQTVAGAIVHAAEHPQRDIIVGGAGKAILMSERMSSSFTDWFMMRGNWAFRLQKTDRPDDGRDNLNSPMETPQTTRGNFESITKPTSLYTRHLELHPGRKRLLFGLLAAGAVWMMTRKPQQG